MTGQSRRSFLVTAGAGAALGAGAIATGTTRSRGTPSPMADDEPTPTPTLVAYVQDVASGRITLMAGDREISVSDPVLVRALARKVV